MKMKGWLIKNGLVRYIYSRCVAGLPIDFYMKKISGINNRVKINTQIIWRSSIYIKGENNCIFIDGSILIRKLSIKIIGNNNNIYIGNGCQIKNGIIWIEGDKNTCKIGRNTTIESAEFYLTEKNTTIDIGHDCMFAKTIIFRTGDSHTILDNNDNILNPAGNITIGNHVWIGQGVTLLKNSTVGQGSIVGTCSVVNKEFKEENIIIAGVPAKKVKSGIRWIRERLVNN